MNCSVEIFQFEHAEVCDRLVKTVRENMALDGTGGLRRGHLRLKWISSFSYAHW